MTKDRGDDQTRADTIERKAAQAVSRFIAARNADPQASPDRFMPRDPREAAEFRKAIEGLDLIVENVEPDEAGPTETIQEPRRTDLSIPGYRIARELGRGGMGIVYEAQQENPRRPVALKVIRGGRFLEEHHVRLFRREEQTLARLKHSGIAAIYEAGRTDDGQHFFAMELVRGVSLNEYVRVRQPVLRARLTLFHKICEAINYAHQRGVIHRDLKPSNVLIDSEGNPKILDFGLARITDSDIATTTVVTEIGKIQGTLPYMSPEQARGNPDEIDLRSDVYSLGVILYELLTEELPYDVSGTLVHEAVRVICEEPPRKPSTISRTLRGDLETIALKALAKEPSRRYQSASALAEDITRYLADLPILARPPSAVYQFKKLVARHRIPFVLMGVLFLVILSFSVWMSMLYVRAINAEKRAHTEAETAQQVSGFLVGLFELSDPSEARGKTVTAREILDEGVERIRTELEAVPEIRAALMEAMGHVYQNLGLLDEAVPLKEAVLHSCRELYGETHIRTAVSATKLGRLRLARGEYAEAESLFREAADIYRKHYGAEHDQVATALSDLAALATYKGDYDEAEALRREGLATYRKCLGDDHPEVVTAMNNLATVLHSKGQYEEAETLFREVLDTVRKLHGDDHPDVATALFNLARMLVGRGEYVEGDALLRETLAIHRKLYGDEHSATLNVRRDLANSLWRQGKRSEAMSVLRELLETQRRILPRQHPDTASTLILLGVILLEQDAYAEAEPLLRECLGIRQSALPEDHWAIANTTSILGESLAGQGKFVEAEPLLLEAYTVLKQNPQALPVRVREALERIIKLYDAWEKADKAAEYRALLPDDRPE